MAGDWIKVEQATLDKPEVLRAAEMLNIHRREALGLFVEFWIWLDKNLSASCPDFVRNMSAKSLDEVLHTPGFSGVLKSIGWAKFDDEQSVLYVMNAERHNGNTAKSRALDAKRKKEKRREEKRYNPCSPHAPVRGVLGIYPGPRKVAKSEVPCSLAFHGLRGVGRSDFPACPAMKLSTPQWRRRTASTSPRH
jgi:hypothetical protein